MLQYDDSAFYFVALSFITIYIVPCKFHIHVIVGYIFIPFAYSMIHFSMW